MTNKLHCMASNTYKRSNNFQVVTGMNDVSYVIDVKIAHQKQVRRHYFRRLDRGDSLRFLEEGAFFLIDQKNDVNQKVIRITHRSSSPD